jgi:hypothetical protein
MATTSAESSGNLLDLPLDSGQHQTYSYIQRHQDLLETNEDLIAAIVENLQLGRLADSFAHLSVLQHNLVNMGLEIDNYPSHAVGSPYEAIELFPDEVRDASVYGSYALRVYTLKLN